MNSSNVPTGGHRTQAQLNAALAAHQLARAAYIKNPTAANAAKVRAALRKVEREEICQSSFANRIS